MTCLEAGERVGPPSGVIVLSCVIWLAVFGGVSSNSTRPVIFGPSRMNSDTPVTSVFPTLMGCSAISWSTKQSMRCRAPVWSRARRIVQGHADQREAAIRSGDRGTGALDAVGMTRQRRLQAARRLAIGPASLRTVPDTRNIGTKTVANRCRFVAGLRAR